MTTPNTLDAQDTQDTQDAQDAQDAQDTPTMTPESNPLSTLGGEAITPRSLQQFMQVTNYLGEAVSVSHTSGVDAALVMPPAIVRFIFDAVVEAFDRRLLAGGAPPEMLNASTAQRVKAKQANVLGEIDFSVALMEKLAEKNPAFTADLARVQKQAAKAREFLATLPEGTTDREQIAALVQHTLEEQMGGALADLLPDAEEIIAASKSGTLADLFGGRKPSTPVA